MPIADAFSYTATIERTEYVLTADSQQVKQKTIIYQDIPCRVHNSFGTQKENGSPGAKEKPQNYFVAMVPAEYADAERGDSFLFEGNEYLITKTHFVRGGHATPLYGLYYLEEKK